MMLSNGIIGWIDQINSGFLKNEQAGRCSLIIRFYTRNSHLTKSIILIEFWADGLTDGQGKFRSNLHSTGVYLM